MDPKLKIILIISGVILVLYFIMSPYQNCMRGGGDDGLISKKDVCLRYTSW